jgi:hypothetical protein
LNLLRRQSDAQALSPQPRRTTLPRPSKSAALLELLSDDLALALELIVEADDERDDLALALELIVEADDERGGLRTLLGSPARSCWVGPGTRSRSSGSSRPRPRAALLRADAAGQHARGGTTNQTMVQ